MKALLNMARKWNITLAYSSVQLNAIYLKHIFAQKNPITAFASPNRYSYDVIKEKPSILRKRFGNNVCICVHCYAMTLDAHLFARL